MFTIPEQFSAATKANFDTQFKTMSILTNTALATIEKVVSLNMDAAKGFLETSITSTRQFLDIKGPQDFFQTGATQIHPIAERAVAYGRQVTSLASNTQAEFSKVAVALVDDVAKNAPAGSENAMALVKSAIGNANAGCEQLVKTTTQAIDAFETNIHTTANQFAQTAEKNANHAKK